MSTGHMMLTAAAFAGVNYLEALGQNTTVSELDNLLKDDKSIIQHNVNSIFNKYTVFQYAPLNAGTSYRIGGHFIGFSNNLKTDSEYETDSAVSIALTRLKNIPVPLVIAPDQRERYINDQADRALGVLHKTASTFRQTQTNILSNPTATQLKEWGANTSAATVVGFQPYSLTDFMYCKYYGKIPNNRLVTLRRYPFPISDSLKLSQDDPKKNAIPIAQAVTWFGTETGNDLNKIGLFAWDMPFQPIQIQQQDITGNEVTLDSMLGLLDGIGGGSGKKIADALRIAYSASSGRDGTIQQLTGYEEKIQAYQKRLYTDGPYWNRIYGPVNVIHETTRRSMGIQSQNWQTPMVIKFAYKFRSFNGLSPKVAALDLISNFINLTYNDAQFLGQLARYFPKLGLKFSPSTTEAFGKILTNWGTTYTGNNSQEYMQVLTNMIASLELVGSKMMQNPTNLLKNGIQAAIGSNLAQALPDLIAIKSALSDRPIGEWHLVVGNPMNPIFVMGDLICTNVLCEWDQEIGPDDFPTGITFTVTLKQGKPRDKTAIERMLNAGETKLTAGSIKTSSMEDTFGEANNNLWKDVTSDSSDLTKSKKIKEYYNSLSDTGKTQYIKFRNRALSGYGVPAKGTEAALSVSKSDILDDSLLLYYFQREYGKN